MNKRVDQAGNAALALSGDGEADLAGTSAVGTACGHQVEYLADMILELGELAQGMNCPTLAGILDLAWREARLEARRR
jgi:hypothetical protein